MKKRRKKTVGDFNEYLKAVKSADRLIELERNGWRWTAKDRPHKNKKKYDRKRDRRIDYDGPIFVELMTDFKQCVFNRFTYHSAYFRLSKC